MKSLFDDDRHHKFGEGGAEGPPLQHLAGAMLVRSPEAVVQGCGERGLKIGPLITTSGDDFKGRVLKGNLGKGLKRSSAGVVVRGVGLSSDVACLVKGCSVMNVGGFMQWRLSSRDDNIRGRVASLESALYLYLLIFLSSLCPLWIFSSVELREKLIIKRFGTFLMPPGPFKNFLSSVK